MANQFSLGFDAYISRHWEEKQEIFDAILQKFPNDTRAQIYYTRCIALQEEPLGPNRQPITHL